jgi:DNA polymerase III subunit epsilon
MRQVVLDTETTGLEADAGHRIIELGCVELVNRRVTNNKFHRYMNPDRPVDQGALEVHGLDNAFLASQPRFAEVAAEFIDFVRGAELVIHNADFDVGFINAELRRLGNGAPREIRDCCGVLDTLALARRLHPGQRNSLDALARRYEVDNSRRELHGALLDAEILAEVYLAMTGGQVSLSLEGNDRSGVARGLDVDAVDRGGLKLTVLVASEEEQAAHRAILERIREHSGRPSLWEQLGLVSP